MSSLSTDEYAVGQDPPPAFHIEIDLPGQRLQLVWQGDPPRKTLRRVGSLVVALAGLAVVEFVRRLVLPTIQEAIAKPPGDVIPIAVLSVFLLVTSVVAAWQILPAFGRAAGYWSGFDWDRGEKTFTASFYTWGFGGNRSVQVALSSISSLSFSVGAPGVSLLPIEMTLWCFDAKGKSHTIVAPLVVENLNRRAEAMDLLFRIARILDFAGYAISRNNHRRLELQILRMTRDERAAERKLAAQEAAEDDDDLEEDDEEEDDELADEDSDQDDYLSIPADQDVARYGSDTSTRLKQPPLPAPLLDLQKLAAEVEFTKVAEWKPGERVRLLRPPAPTGVPVVLAILGAMVGGAIGALPLAPPLMWLAQPWDMPQWAAGVIGACVGIPVALALMWRRLEERKVTFDLTAGNVTWQQGKQRGQAALSSIESLELGGVRAERRSDQADQPRPGVRHEYRCQLKMVLKDRDELLIETDRWATSPDEPYLQLLPFTGELARALDVPWRWVDRREKSANPYLPRMTYARSIAAAALIAALGIWIAMRGQALVDKQQSIAHLRSQGIECGFLNGSSFRDLHKINDFYRVAFKPGPQLDTQLADVRGDLASIGRFGVELSSSGVGDAGVATLAQQPNLVQLDLAVTPISDDALSILGTSTNIEYLNVSSTQVGDAGLRHVAQLPRLAILLAAYTQVTDDGLPALVACQQLRYVNLAGTAVTDQGLRRLQAALPHAVIEKQ